MDTPHYRLNLRYWYHWNVPVVSSVMVQVPFVCIAWLSRYSCFSCIYGGLIHGNKVLLLSETHESTTQTYYPIISDTLQHPRQLQREISGVQQLGLVASQWCKNLAAGCFKEGTGNYVRKYMIRADYWMFRTLTLNCFSGSGNWRSNSIFQLSDPIGSAFVSIV